MKTGMEKFNMIKWLSIYRHIVMRINTGMTEDSEL